MVQNNIIKNRRRYIGINFVLFAVLFLLVSFNKEFIRPIYGHTPIIGIITGCFSNFMAAYIISLFPIAAILSKNIKIQKSRYIFYITAILVFSVLTIEEINPFMGASEVYDIYDIIANGLGIFIAILTFESFVKKLIVKRLK